MLFPQLITATFLIIRKLNSATYRRRLPPTPPSLPIIGHFHLIHKPYHRSLQSLLSQYGPILYLRFGKCRILVISTPQAIEECLTKTNDVAFANRPNFLPGKYLGYNYSNIVWAPYGDHWRNLRRITAHEVFSPQSLQTTSCIRTEEVRRLAGELYRNCNDASTELSGLGKGAVIDLNRALFMLTQNIVMRTVSGKRWPVGGEIDELFVSRTGFMTVCDFFPVLKWVGPYRGVERELKRLWGDRDRFLQGLIDDEVGRGKGELGKDEMRTIVEMMLKLQRSDPEYYTDDVIKGNILLMFSAGSETSARTMEWAMSLLLNNPTTFQKARQEIDTHISHQDHRLVEESDLPSLPYLQCILHETLRLFPAAPLLLPHYSTSDLTISGYHIPRGTMLWVNAWAMHRDPKVWKEPLVFRPERFYDEQRSSVVDDGEERNKSNNRFKYIPFGVGRRVCPGINMAMRIMSLTVATLVQCFDWEKIREEDGGGDGSVDLEEKGVGVTVPKNEPLYAVCRIRPSMVSLLSHLSLS